MQNLLTRIALASALVAAALALSAADKVSVQSQGSHAPAAPAAPARIIALASPPVSAVIPAPVDAVGEGIPAGTESQALGTLSSFPQYIKLRLDNAPLARVGTVAVVDTEIAAGGRMLRGRVEVARGNGAGSANAHGSMMSAAIVAPYSNTAMSNAGAATGGHIVFYGCALGGGIDLECARQSLDAAAARGIRVVNLSFEVRSEIPAPVVAAWSQSVAAASQRGVIVVAASGEGPGLPFPARVSGVVSVSRIGSGGNVVNRAAFAAAPASNLTTVNANGKLVIGYGSSYATAYVSAIAARLVGAKPSLTASQLRRAVKGRVTMVTAAKRAGVKVGGVARPGCVRIVRIGSRRTIKWGRVRGAARYSITVGRLPIIVPASHASLTTAIAGSVRVQALGAYGTAGPIARVC